MSDKSIYGSIPESWEHLTIGDLITRKNADVQTGPFGTMLHAKSYQEIGIPVVAVQHIGENKIIHDSEIPRVNAEDYQRLSRYSLTTGDIVFGRKGGVDRRALVSEREVGWLQGSDCIRVRFDLTVIDSQYISYVLGSKPYKEWIVRNAQGATMPSLNQEVIRRIPLPLPPLKTQQAIARVLAAFDEKIELNRRTNQTLENLARAVFQSWFVNFDPVRARLEGRDYPLQADVLELFPRDFDGDAPRGWEIKSVGSEFNLVMGQSPPGDTYNESGQGLPFYQGCTDFGFRYPTPRVYCTAPTRLGRIGDTLVSVRAPVGDINMSREQCCIGRGVASIRHKLGYRSFTYYGMQNLSSAFGVFEGEGTVFGSINKADFAALPFIVPNSRLVQAFELFAEPLDQQIETNDNEIRSLTQTRDSLLPQLLSGEVTVRDAEQALEEI